METEQRKKILFHTFSPFDTLPNMRYANVFHIYFSLKICCDVVVRLLPGRGVDVYRPIMRAWTGPKKRGRRSRVCTARRIFLPIFFVFVCVENVTLISWLLNQRWRSRVSVRRCCKHTHTHIGITLINQIKGCNYEKYSYMHCLACVCAGCVCVCLRVFASVQQQLLLIRLDGVTCRFHKWQAVNVNNWLQLT